MDLTSGSIIYCADDQHAAALCRDRARAVSYGESLAAAYQSRNIQLTAGGSRFDAYRSGELLGSVDLGVPGRHNVSNALAVIALASELGVSMPPIAQALATFRGARRRFEAKLQNEYIRVFDD
jgi:UDP-N-acetylmuramate-alanine ligase